MDRTPAEFLATIEIGSQVAWLEYRSSLQEATLATVERLTPTQFVLVVRSHGRQIGYRARRKDGALVGNWSAYLRDPSDDRVIKALARSRFGAALRDIQTLAGAISIKNPVHARTQLGRIAELAEGALLDLSIS